MSSHSNQSYLARRLDLGRLQSPRGRRFSATWRSMPNSMLLIIQNRGMYYALPALGCVVAFTFVAGAAELTRPPGETPVFIIYCLAAAVLFGAVGIYAAFAFDRVMYSRDDHKVVWWRYRGLRRTWVMRKSDIWITRCIVYSALGLRGRSYVGVAVVANNGWAALIAIDTNPEVIENYIAQLPPGVRDLLDSGLAKAWLSSVPVG